MSLHPPHLIDSSGSLTPAALIPFCAYQTDMTMLGQTNHALNSVVCSKFKPTVLKGQLCYSIDSSSLPNVETKEGMKNGLVLILDPGRQEDMGEKKTGLIPEDHIMSLNLESKIEISSSAWIFLNTLARYANFGAGSYAMTALKRMKGTDSFLHLPDEEKKCQIETSADCHAKQYIKKVRAECGCVPWALSSALQLKNPTFCAPNASACYAAVAFNYDGCRVSCTGLYADVQFTDDKILVQDMGTCNFMKIL